MIIVLPKQIKPSAVMAFGATIGSSFGSLDTGLTLSWCSLKSKNVAYHVCNI